MMGGPALPAGRTRVDRACEPEGGDARGTWGGLARGNVYGPVMRAYRADETSLVVAAQAKRSTSARRPGRDVPAAGIRDRAQGNG